MKPFVVANWKMNMTAVKAIQFVQRFRDQVKGVPVDVVICPPFTALSVLRYELNKQRASLSVALNQRIRLGAQNIHAEAEGAFTGEVSSEMVKELAEYVIIGHSERRRLFKETDADIHKKLKAAHAVGLTPILCVGAVVDQKQGEVSHFVEKQLHQQLTNSLTGLRFGDGQKLVVAYEPPAAIGSGNAADPKRVGHVLHFVRRQLDQMFGGKVAAETPLLYGGSVKSNNVVSFLAEKECNGVLVGGASLSADEFARIVLAVR